MEKIKDTTAASYNLDGNLVLIPKIAPFGCFCDLVSSFWHFTKLEKQRYFVLCANLNR